MFDRGPRGQTDGNRFYFTYSISTVTPLFCGLAFTTRGRIRELGLSPVTLLGTPRDTTDVGWDLRPVPPDPAVTPSGPTLRDELVNYDTSRFRGLEVKG